MSDQQSVTENYVAIIDIGSNAVRLVIYDGLNRAPIKIHGERTICNLGADLATTGCLNAESVKKALNSMRRFAGLLQAMKIVNVRTVATAAVRDAKDGKDFVDAVQNELGLAITVIDGEEEARLSAVGVLANGLGGHGVIGDYGGGSLELIVVDNGKVQHKASLPLGSHRLLAETSREERIKKIEAHLQTVDFLKDYIGHDFYALGGAWRSMAVAHIYMSQHPLKLLDHYYIDGKKAIEFAALISQQSLPALEKTVGMSQKRIKDLAVAALTMEHLFEKIRPQQLIFSGTGLREGLLFDQLPPSLQQQDGLLAGCEKVALKTGRFDGPDSFRILFRWLEPLFSRENAKFKRLLEASCLLSDISWLEHEDYQGEYAFRRILVMPFYGIDHAGRAFLALSQYVRYKGYGFAGESNDITEQAYQLLDEETINLAITAGLAQRLGYFLTGGALGLLRSMELSVRPQRLVLKLSSKTDRLNTEGMQEAMKSLAEILEREAAVEG